MPDGNLRNEVLDLCIAYGVETVLYEVLQIRKVTPGWHERRAEIAKEAAKSKDAPNA